MTTQQKKIIWDQNAGGFLFDENSVTYWPATAKTFTAEEVAALLSRKDSLLGNKSNIYTPHNMDSLDDLNRLIRTPDGEKLSIELPQDDDGIKGIFMKARLQQCRSQGAENSLLSAFLEHGASVTLQYVPESVARDIAERENPLPPIDYAFLKSHNNKERAYHVDGNTLPNARYSSEDESTVIQQSRNDPDQVYAIISAGEPGQENAFSMITAVDSVADIVNALEDAFECMPDEPTEQPMISFVVNNAVEVKAFYDEQSDGVYIRMNADEVLVTLPDLNEAKKQIKEALEGHGYYGASAEKSYITIGDARIPFFAALPQLDELEPFYAPNEHYSELRLCHLYQNGSCIARIELDDPQILPEHILLTHPGDGMRFKSISHAQNYTFGISNQISAKEASLYHIGAGKKTDLSTAVNSAIDDVNAFRKMLSTVSNNNAIPFEQAKEAFWDVFSGNVNGKDLRQYERMTQLYVDVVRQTSAAFDRAGPICKLWLNRLSDFQKNITPDERARTINDDYTRKHELPASPQPAAPERTNTMKR